MSKLSTLDWEFGVLVPHRVADARVPVISIPCSWRACSELAPCSFVCSFVHVHGASR